MGVPVERRPRLFQPRGVVVFLSHAVEQRRATLVNETSPTALGIHR
jgi:hypothetical protein